MFLRLCVAVLMGTIVQTALADEVSEFEAELTSYQQKMPAACQIKSPAMKLAYACAKIQSPDANPRFYGTIDAGQPGSPAKSSNGVNFCYNSLVEVKKNGGQLTVNVTRDSGQSPRSSSFVVNQANLTRDSDGYVLPLEGLKGHCFGYSQAVNSNCGFGSDVAMALRVDADRSNVPTQSLTAERNVISDSRRNGSQLAALNARDDVADAKKAAIDFARKQLVAHATKKLATNAKPPPPGGANPYDETEKANFRRCDQMLINMESSTGPSLVNNPYDHAAVTEYRRRISPAQQGGPKAPAATGQGTGVRER